MKKIIERYIVQSIILCESCAHRVYTSRASLSHEIDYHADLIMSKN